MLDHSAGGVARQQGILRKLHAWRGGVTEAFFGHESRAELAPLRDGKVSGGLTVDQHRARVLRQPFARKCCEKLVLSVAGDAGDAQDFATFQLERDVLEPYAVRIVGLEAEIVDDESRHCG